MNKLNIILNKLKKLKKNKNNTWSASCPAHNDSSPSLGIKLTDDKILLKCLAGCDTVDILEAIDLNMSDLFLDEKEDIMETATALEEKKVRTFKDKAEILENYPNREGAFEYTDPSTSYSTQRKIDLLVIKYRDSSGKKQYPCFHFENGLWHASKPKGLLPLYNRGRIIEATAKDIIIVVEGEKDVISLHKYGYIATTSPGGASNASAADWSILKDKRVVIWGDNDAAGERYANDVCEILSELNITCNQVDISGLELEEKQDVSDFIDKIIASGRNQKMRDDQIRTLITDSLELIFAEFFEDVDPIAQVDEYFAMMRSGQIKNLEFCNFPILTQLSQALLNKSMVALTASPGKGKSLFLGQSLDYLHLSENINVKRLHLEDDIGEYVNRSISQILDRPELMDPKWHEKNSDESCKILEDNKEIKNKITMTIKCGESVMWNVNKALAWLEDVAKTGCQLAAVDPASMLFGNNAWLDSLKLITSTRKIMAKYPNFRVIFLSHFNEVTKQIAGGSSTQRFCQSSLFLMGFETPERWLCEDANGNTIERTIDRYVLVSKCRRGSGMGAKIAFMQDGMRLIEIGRMISKIKDK